MQERRRFYRIDDELSLNYRVVQSAGIEQDISKAKQNYTELVDLKNALHCIDARMDVISTRLEKEHPLLAELITLMNKKFAIHEKMLGTPDNDDHKLTPARQVNLSASGVAFSAETPLKEGSYIKMEMVLYPDHHYISAFAKVVSCRQGKEGKASGYNIAVDFEGLSEGDEEKIINHIFKKQAEELKQKREKSDDKDESDIASTG